MGIRTHAKDDLDGRIDRPDQRNNRFDVLPVLCDTGEAPAVSLAIKTYEPVFAVAAGFDIGQPGSENEG